VCLGEGQASLIKRKRNGHPTDLLRGPSREGKRQTGPGTYGPLWTHLKKNKQPSAVIRAKEEKKYKRYFSGQWFAERQKKIFAVKSGRWLDFIHSRKATTGKHCQGQKDFTGPDSTHMRGRKRKKRKKGTSGQPALSGITNEVKNKRRRNARKTTSKDAQELEFHTTRQ